MTQQTLSVVWWMVVSPLGIGSVGGGPGFGDGHDLRPGQAGCEGGAVGVHACRPGRETRLSVD